jgi:hypothetical protein
VVIDELGKILINGWNKSLDCNTIPYETKLRESSWYCSGLAYIDTVPG